MKYFGYERRSLVFLMLLVPIPNSQYSPDYEVYSLLAVFLMYTSAKVDLGSWEVAERKGKSCNTFSKVGKGRHRDELDYTRMRYPLERTEYAILTRSLECILFFVASIFISQETPRYKVGGELRRLSC